jgi:chain length determinant protein EpsF
MDFNQFLLALRARRRVFWLVFGATVFAAVAIALIVPKNYVASTTVLIDARSDQTMSPAERMSPRERTGYLQTQVDLIQSGKVAKMVVRELRYTQLPGVREKYESDTGGLGNIEDWAAAELLKKLKVDASASNILSVQFSSPDPKLSADVANGFARAYLETSLDLKTEPSRQASAWFEDQLKGLRSAVSQAQTKLTAYQKKKGIFSTEERTDPEALRLTELSSQLMAARNATYDAETRYKHATEYLATGASADTLPEVMANPAVQALQAELVRSETRLQEAANDLGPRHPAYIRQASEVQGLRSKLGAEMKKVVKGLSNAAAQSRKREEELKKAYAAQENRVLSMRDARVQLGVMMRDVENAQRTYEAALSRWLTNKVEARAQTTNIAVVTPAVAPIEAKSPKVGLIAGLSLIIGALLAGGVVFLLETTDRRVRSRFDLESRLAVPTLGRLSRWQPIGGRLLPVPLRTARALPHPW